MRAASIVAVVLVGGCTPHSAHHAFEDARVVVPPVDALVPDTPPDAAIDAARPFCDAIDILLVIGNESTMAAYQANVSANAQALIDALDHTGLSYRIGITNAARDYHYAIMTGPFGNSPGSTHGDSGRILEMAGCGMTRRWINYTDPARATKLACAVNQGTTGPAAQMPLGALRDAFEARLADNTNAGFHRPDALLGVVMLSDGNDCSYVQSVTFMQGQTLCTDLLEPVDSYITFVDGVVGGRSHWAAAVIANTSTAACTGGLGGASPAPRLGTFATDLMTSGTASTICTSDLGSGLTQAVAAFAAACH
jgi:hypothetical protein